jgi:thymidylate synthase
MAIPPCHILCQFYVSSNNQELSCHLYQRSGDLGLGVPFNIASYALLTHLIAQVCNLNLGYFIHSFGDVHVYQNHVEALQKQLERSPKKFPKLRLNKKVREIDDFKLEDIVLENYESYDSIKMEMSI